MLTIDVEQGRRVLDLARDVVAAHAGGSIEQGAVREVALTWGRSAQVAAGHLDERAHDVFRNGQCHALALVLAATSGWPMVWVGAAECCYDVDCADFPEWWGWCPCQFKHVGVLDGRGWFVDIDGALTQDEVVAAATEQYDEPHGLFQLTAGQLEHIVASSSWRAPEITLARTFVAPLLARMNAERGA